MSDEDDSDDDEEEEDSESEGDEEEDEEVDLEEDEDKQSKAHKSSKIEKPARKGKGKDKQADTTAETGKARATKHNEKEKTAKKEDEEVKEAVEAKSKEGDQQYEKTGAAKKKKGKLMRQKKELEKGTGGEKPARKAQSKYTDKQDDEDSSEDKTQETGKEQDSVKDKKVAKLAKKKKAKLMKQGEEAPCDDELAPDVQSKSAPTEDQKDSNLEEVQEKGQDKDEDAQVGGPTTRKKKRLAKRTAKGKEPKLAEAETPPAKFERTPSSMDSNKQEKEETSGLLDEGKAKGAKRNRDDIDSEEVEDVPEIPEEAPDRKHARSFPANVAEAAQAGPWKTGSSLLSFFEAVGAFSLSGLVHDSADENSDSQGEDAPKPAAKPATARGPKTVAPKPSGNKPGQGGKFAVMNYKTRETSAVRQVGGVQLMQVKVKGASLSQNEAIAMKVVEDLSCFILLNKMSCIYLRL